MSAPKTTLENQLAEVDQLLHADVKQALLKTKDLYKAAKKEKNEYFQGLAHRKMAMCYYKTGKLIEALTLFENALNIWKALKDYKYIVSEYISIGVVYRNQGEIDKSLENYLKAQKISERENLTKSLLYNNIAVIYEKQREYNKAISYYEKALKIENQNQIINHSSIATILINIAYLNIQIKNYDKAKKYCFKVLDICKNKKLGAFTTSGYRLLGKIFFYENDYSKAHKYLEIAKSLSEQELNWIEFIKISIELSPVLKYFKKYNERAKVLKLALDKAIEYHQDSIIPCLEALLKHYEEIKDFENAYFTMQQLNEFIEKERVRERSLKIQELQSQFELSEQKKLLKQSESFNKIIVQKNKDLQKAIDEIEWLQLKLSGLHMQLKPHFIFNTLQSIQHYILHKKPDEASEYLAKFARFMRQVLNACNLETISLTKEIDLLKNYIELEAARFNHKFSFSIESKNIKEEEEIIIPSLLIQPFVENAILHGVSKIENGNLKLIFRLYKKNLYVHILDNGVGMKPSKVFKKEEVEQVKALQLIKDRSHLSQQLKLNSFKFKVLNRASKRTNKTGVHTFIAIQL